MAQPSYDGRPEQVPYKPKGITAFKLHTKIPRRQLTLVTITSLLNILLLSALLCIFSALYQVASDPGDTESTASEVLTLVSVSLL